MSDQRKESIRLPDGTQPGDILMFEHQPGKPTYYRAELRAHAHKKRLGALCADAMERKN